MGERPLQPSWRVFPDMKIINRLTAITIKGVAMRNLKVLAVTISLLMVLAGNIIAQDRGVDPACEQISLEGVIEAVSDTTVTVEGKVFNLKEGIIYKNGSKENLKVGVLIDIRAKKEDEVNWFAWKITFLETEGTKKDFNGKIEYVTDTGITVNGTFIYCNDETQYIKGSKEDLKAGVMVWVKARFEENAWIASQVKFTKGNDDPNKDTFQVIGLITNISPGLVTVGDTVFKVTAATKFYNTKLSKLEIGMQVLVIAKIEDEKNVAIKIKLLDKKNGDIKTITDSVLFIQVNGEEVTVNLAEGETFTVAADFPVHGRTGLPVTAADLIPMQILRVKIKEDKVISVNVTGNIVRKGKITALITDGDMAGFVMNEKNFYLDKFTYVKDLRPASAPNEDFEFEVDMKVLVIGNRLADESVLADKIIVEPGKDKKRIYETGIITELTMENDQVVGLSMNGYDFVLPANMEINVSKFKGKLLNEELIPGLTAKIRGYQDEEGNYVIKKITIYLPYFCLNSVVQEAAEDFILIDDFKVYFREETKFDDEEWPTYPGEIVMGDKIEICFVLWTDGKYVATKVSAGE